MNRCLLLSFFLLTVSESKLFAQEFHPARFDIDGVQIQFFDDGNFMSVWNYPDALEHFTADASKLAFASANAPTRKIFNTDDAVYRIHLTMIPINQKTAIANHAHELRLGTSYYPSKDNYGYYDNETIRGDTLFSNGWNYTQWSQELSVDASYLFKTNQGMGFNFFAGIGGGTGLSFNSFIQAGHGYGVSLYNVDSVPRSYLPLSGNHSKGQSFAKNSLFLNSYFPLGFEVPVLKNFRFTLEEDIGLSWQIFSHASNVLRFQYATGIGLKYLW